MTKYEFTPEFKEFLATTWWLVKENIWALILFVISILMIINTIGMVR